MANVSFSTTDKTAQCVLSNLNLTARSNLNAASARTTAPNITGKFYWESTYNTAGSLTGNQNGVALAKHNFNQPTSGFTDDYAIGYASFSSGGVYRNTANIGGAMGLAGVGTIVATAVDLTFSAPYPMGAIWFKVLPSGNWNGSATANPATGIGGLPLWGPGLPIYPIVWLGSTNDQQTFNFGDTAFSGAVPSGFTAGFTANTPAVNVIDTQAAIEEWASAATVSAQLTQAAIEEWASAAGVQLQLTQLGIEAWGGNANELAVQLTQMGIEVWATPTGGATQLVLTKIGAEVWASVPAAPVIIRDTRAIILA